MSQRDAAVGLQAQWRGIKTRAHIRHMRLVRIVAEGYVEQIFLFTMKAHISGHTRTAVARVGLARPFRGYFSISLCALCGRDDFPAAECTRARALSTCA